jgi:hypothetical protein
MNRTLGGIVVFCILGASVPMLGRPSRSEFVGSVCAISSNDVWVAGAQWHGSGAITTLIRHWDGSTWTDVQSANPGVIDNELTGIGGTSSNDLWAVGYSTDASGKLRTLAQHWDGASWKTVPTPDPGNRLNAFNALVVESPRNAWAVGVSQSGGVVSGLIERWDGVRWSPVASPNPGSSNYLISVTALSASDAWAVGYYTSPNYSYSPLILHWDGATWKVVPNPSVAGSAMLTGVAAISSTDIWTVGQLSEFRTLTEHWDGKEWNVVPAPNQGSHDSGLVGVAASSSRDVWAVGGYYASSRRPNSLIEHWNGTTWQIVASPGANTLEGIASLAPNDAWAVGNHGVSYGKALSVHWDGSNWSAVATSSATEFNTRRRVKPNWPFPYPRKKH